MIRFEKRRANFDIWRRINPETMQLTFKVSHDNNYEIDIEYFDGSNYADKSIDYEFDENDIQIDFTKY